MPVADRVAQSQYPRAHRNKPPPYRSTATPQGVVGVTLTYQEHIRRLCSAHLEAPKAHMTTFTHQNSFKQDIATDPRSEASNSTMTH